MSNIAYEMYCERELAKARYTRRHLKCLFYLIKLYLVRKQINRGRGFEIRNK